MRTNRRQFMATAATASAVVALDGIAPSFLVNAAASAADPQKTDSVLVVVQFSGGNDGLNTVVPFRNDVYYKSRPKLAIAADKVVKLNDELGWHPSMSGVAELAKEGMVQVIQGVGYSNPNRSHFESMDIWHTCQRKEKRSQDGWLGRYLDQRQNQLGTDSPAIHLGAEKQPYALAAQHVRTPSIHSVERFRLKTDPGANETETIRSLIAAERTSSDGLLDFVKTSSQSALEASQRIEAAKREYKAAAEYPQTGLAQKLRTVAQLLDAGFTTRVYYLELGGFDTHSQQPDVHASLLAEYSNAVKAFFDDLAKHGHADRVAMLTFSEFGRRVQENASDGTDHGAAAPVFAIGKKVNGGVLGNLPSLTDLDDGDLKFHTDFRQVFAAVMEGWLKCPSEPILGGKFSPTNTFAMT